MHRQKLSGKTIGIYVRLYYYSTLDKPRIMETRVGQIRVRGGFTALSDSG
jgi:hypothetical protein